MKNTTIIALLFSYLLIMSCSGTGRKGAISGEITGAPGKTIYLQRAANNRLMKTDSTTIGADGKFLIVPSQSMSMDFYVLSIDDKNMITVITDSTESLNVKGELNNLQATVRASGSANTEALRELEMQCAPLNKKDQETIQKLSNPAISQEEKDQHRQELTDSRKQRTDIIKTWLDNNTTSLGALIVVRQLDPKADGAYYTKVFEALKPMYGSMPMYKALKQEAQMLNTPTPPANEAAEQNSNVAQGKQAPEIEMKDVNGNTRKLSDLKGKTVLIDFWASWCGPCRGENPNVVKAYDKYNKDGFEVFSVSLDRAKEPWLAAIEKDGLRWKNHVSELKHWDSSAARAYGVNSIPKTFLVDKDGKIIGSDLRGPALEAKLQTIYGH